MSKLQILYRFDSVPKISELKYFAKRITISSGSVKEWPIEHVVAYTTQFFNQFSTQLLPCRFVVIYDRRIDWPKKCALSAQVSLTPEYMNRKISVSIFQWNAMWSECKVLISSITYSIKSSIVSTNFLKWLNNWKKKYHFNKKRGKSKK